MRLLDQFLRRPRPLRLRPPDHTEQRQHLLLQIWADEGYWHVVDTEFHELLRELERPATLEDLFAQHPEWKRHRRPIQAQLRNLEKAGLLGTPRKPAPPTRLENLTINLTTQCNLNCRTCYLPQEYRPPAKVNVPQLLLFLESLHPHFGPAATLSLLGGEPFLHPEAVLAIGRWAKRHHFPCNVSTNGTVRSDPLLRDLAEAGLQVQVSIDGATATTNDLIRGAGTFAKATATVTKLVAAGIPATLCMVCCRENLAEIPDYFQLARGLGAEQVRFIPLKKLGNGQARVITPAPQLEIVRLTCRELDANPASRSMCRTDLYSIIRSMLQESSRRPSCGSGSQTLLVQADGAVFPCVNNTLPRSQLGHITESPEPILARGMEFGNTLAVDSATHPCHDCHVKRWCLAGCPGETLSQDGTLTRRHWNCEDLRQTITFVMWRLASEGQTERVEANRTCL